VATPIWQPGTSYAPGAIVQPASNFGGVSTPLPNGSFEDGATGWTLDAGMSVLADADAFQGANSLNCSITAIARAINDTAVDVIPGSVIHASLQFKTHSHHTHGYVQIAWYDASGQLISYSSGDSIGRTTNWKPSKITATAPAGAASAKFVAYVHRTSGPGTASQVDGCIWDAITPTAPTGLVYRAVQALAGNSGSTEPDWPVTLGSTVVDNEVTWEAVNASRVVWEAQPIMQTGTYEPNWPLEAGQQCRDGTMIWTALDGRITDSKCPNSAAVIVGASKIFAVDDDIIAFCATTNPLDWSTADDAGYLPFGLQTYGAEAASALGLYRGNLVAFNSMGFQMWQIDEDPANMALLDAEPIGCDYGRTVQAVSNDLAFLSKRGVRSIGVAGASTNLQAGYFGKAIDPLVLEKIQNGETPISVTWPDQGQYWLIFEDEAFVLTMNGDTKDASWSRYTFPAAITDAAVLDGELYLRADTYVWKVSDDFILDDQVRCDDGDGTASGTVIAFSGGEKGIATADEVVVDGDAVLAGSAATLSPGGAVPLSPNFSFYLDDIGNVTLAMTGALLAPDQFDFVSISIDMWDNETFDPADAIFSTQGTTAVWVWSHSIRPVIYLPVLGQGLTVIFNRVCTEGTDTEFHGYMAWPYLDLGPIGIEKQMEGFDLVIQGDVEVTIGYSQTDDSIATESFAVYGDTLPGCMIPMPITAPSFQFRLSFAGNQAWEWMASNIYLTDLGRTP
jgi:hypothetical protein